MKSSILIFPTRVNTSPSDWKRSEASLSSKHRHPKAAPRPLYRLHCKTSDAALILTAWKAHSRAQQQEVWVDPQSPWTEAFAEAEDKKKKRAQTELE